MAYLNLNKVNNLLTHM